MGVSVSEHNLIIQNKDDEGSDDLPKNPALCNFFLLQISDLKEPFPQDFSAYKFVNRPKHLNICRKHF